MKLSQKYGYVPAEDAIAGSIQAIASNLDNISSKEVLLQIFSMMDLTTLHTQDTEKSVIKLVEKANALKKEYPSYPQPASVCVFPNFAPVVRDHRLDPALGVGETGLDFRPGMAGRALQLEVLRVHWGLARKHDRPLSLHAVRAHGALLPLMREWGAVRAQVHGFEGNPEIARALCREGFFLSMGRGLLRPTRPDSFARALLAAVPRGRAMFETDSDGPAGLRAVVEGIASRSGIPFGELADDGARSARAFLGF